MHRPGSVACSWIVHVANTKTSCARVSPARRHCLSLPCTAGQEQNSSQEPPCLTWNNASAPTEAGDNVGHQVAVQVGRDQHIKLVRPAHKLHAGVVHNDLRGLDHGVLLGDFPELLRNTRETVSVEVILRVSVAD